MNKAHEDRDDTEHDQAEQQDHKDALKAPQVQAGRIHDRCERKHSEPRGQRGIDDDVGAERAHVLPDHRRNPNTLAESKRIEEQQRKTFVLPHCIDRKEQDESADHGDQADARR
jgi:hypothetical protein